MIHNSDSRGSPSFPVHFNHILEIRTRGKGFYDITHEVRDWLGACKIQNGLVTDFICHTSASLVIQENADPDVLLDLEDSLERVAPRSHPYRHSYEGPDDMPAHIRTMMTSTSIGIPVQDRMMVLGTWQGLYVAEHRDQPHNRKIALHFMGMSA